MKTDNPTYETIKALPSTYAGVKFRSRLEARWAYYFDLIGLPWKYEPDGYGLDAGNYLPDFKCNDFFVEVKPTVGELEKVAPKLAELSKKAAAYVFCVVDDPTAKPQRYWAGGGEVGLGSFCAHAFASKGWSIPYLIDEYDDRVDGHIAQRAAALQFNRGGIAEVDWEVLRARNEVIRRRLEVFKENRGKPFEEYYRQLIQPLDQRLRSLDKLAFPPFMATWRPV